MNILVVHNYYKIRSGEETVFQNEIELLRNHGNKVVVYTRDNKELDQFSALKKFCLPLTTIFSFRTYKEVMRIIRDKKIEIVHVHNYLCLISPSVYYACFRMRVPVVQTIHHFRLNCAGTSFFREGRVCTECIEKGQLHSLNYNCYKNSFVSTFGVALMVEIHKKVGTYNKINFICLTDFNKRMLLSMNRDGEKYITPSRVFVKPNFSSFNHEIIQYDKRRKRIIYAGRLYENKGIRILFEAWKEIKEYELLVFGAGPEESWCKSFIIKYGIKNVKMMGSVKNSELEDCIADSRALILPTQWYEGFPMVLVESFACGTPVLGSRIGNVGSIIQEGINGFHFDQSSADSIVEAVGKLHDICESTKRTSEELYNPEANYRILMDIYEKCMDKSH